MRRMIFWMMMVALVMGLIFYMSHEPATVSREYSMRITERIFHGLEKVIPGSQMDWGFLHHTIRKSAHFFIYMTLGIFVFLACMQSRMFVYYSIGLAMIICVLFAITDEVHQLFIPGRSGELRDVLIDSSGALLGILFVLSIKSIRKRVRQNK